MNTTDASEKFRAAIMETGLEPPEMIIADGRIHRFASNGRRGDDAGWYSSIVTESPLVLSAAGDMGCHRRGGPGMGCPLWKKLLTGNVWPRSKGNAR